MAPASSRPKTVFLAVHQGFAARYLLRTDILPTLRAGGARVVILTPNHDEPYMVEEFAAEDVTLEPLRADVGAVRRGGRFPSRLGSTYNAWWILSNLRRHSLGNAGETIAAAEKYGKFRDKWMAKKPDRMRVVDRAFPALQRSRLLRRLVLRLETALFPAKLHTDLFERHRPDLVVTTSPGYWEADAYLLREARARRVPSVACILGWDNPSSKGYRGADPDRVVVWSERMADQVVAHQDVPRSKTFVGGVPHFDRYHRHGALMGREELFAHCGLDPARRLIVYATSTPGLYRHNALAVRALAEAIEEDRLGVPAQIVVRLHPIYGRGGDRDNSEDYEGLAERFPHVHLDVPQLLSQRLRVDMPASDADRLGALLRHCDVLVSVFSTTTLEAFVLDRPTVLVPSDFHLPAGKKGTTRAFADYAHIRRVIDQRAARVASSPVELVDLTAAYLADPSRDREARRRLAREETGPHDGRSGARIGNYLLGRMGLPPVPGPPAAEPGDLPQRPATSAA